MYDSIDVRNVVEAMEIVLVKIVAILVEYLSTHSSYMTLQHPFECILDKTSQYDEVSHKHDSNPFIPV